MTAPQIIFWLISVAAIASAVLVVTVRNLIHAALWLIVTLFCLAGMFAILEAGFMVATQVVVYIGAIAILIIFATMLTRHVMEDSGPQTNRNWWLAAVLAVLSFVGLFSLVIMPKWQDLPVADVSQAIANLGHSFVDPNQFVLPFEVASVLLIAALVGAIAIALARKQPE
jgi:NADH-quinone oxidoreductase subunit J